MDSIFGLAFFILLILVGMIVGTGIERHHFRRLAEREARFKNFLVTNLRTIPRQFENRQAFLVIGSAVIATDYFKVFTAGLRNLFGGEVKSYVTLMERARREAILRMLEQAASQGAAIVWNVRYETTSMKGNSENKPGGVEIIAYGTALK
ncbi:MAG: YbjQ family protein [Planctomycetaceae bacterium]|nr:YbjQ family protein [Planctomycetaceae bacterium]